MTFDEFMQKNNGKYLDYDGAFGAQCVDVILYYCRDVLGLPALWGNAIDIFGEQPSRYDWTKNVYGDTSQIPQKGDILVWGTNVKVGTGIYGHIAINRNASGTAIQSYDQNWPPNSPCHIQNHTYDGIIGWGRPKTIPANVPLIPYGLAPVSFGQWLHSGRKDLKGHPPLELYGQYLREAYPDRGDLLQNGKPAADWLQNLLGEMVKEVQV